MTDQLKISNAIVHQINKGRNQTATALKASAPLSTDGALTNLVTGVNDFFDGRRHIIYGGFDKDDQYTRVNINEYTNGKVNFTKCTHAIVDILVKMMNSQSWSTGGYILFAHYKLSSNEHFAISMINDIDGVAIDDKTLTVRLTKHIELGRLHQAVRVDLADMATDSKEYLSFIRSNPSDNVAQYFFSAMGCSEHKDEVAITSRVINSITTYLKEIKAFGDNRIALRSRAYDYLKMQRENREEATMLGLSSALHVENAPIAFLDFLKKRRYKIPESFHVDRSIRKMRHYRGSGENYVLSFEEEALTNREIQYNKTSKTLTICKIPDRLLKRLNERE